MAKRAPFSLLSYGVPRVEDRRVSRGIVDVRRDGFRWNDAPNAEGRHKTLSNGTGRPLRIALTAGQRSDDDSARLRCADFPAAKQVLAEKGDDAAWFRDGFATRTISACIPARAKGSRPARHAVRRVR